MHERGIPRSSDVKNESNKSQIIKTVQFLNEW